MRAQHLAHAAAPGDAEAAATLRRRRPGLRPQAPAVAADWLQAARRADRPRDRLATTLVEAGRLTSALEIIDHAAEVAPDARLAVRASIERAARSP